jgi:hypothetical protein
VLFSTDLDKIVYERYKLHKCDDIVIVSGYVGPEPIRQISKLPIHTTIVYGMYGCDGIGKGLHEALIEEDKQYSNVDIYYSRMPVHSKIYMWRYKGEVIHALIGSANFSTNGLTTPNKETLAETTADTFTAIDTYYKLIQQRWLRCTDKNVVLRNRRNQTLALNKKYDPDVCSVPLFIVENGKEVIQKGNGLNWGMAKLTGSHVNINDACIAIPAEISSHYEKIFPQKRLAPKDTSKLARRDHRDNDPIDIIWDDGTTMTGLLEGTRTKTIDGVKVEFAKQIATTPKKRLLGEYIRKRLGVPEGTAIQMSDLERYGRKTIDISLCGEGVYYFDFSVDKSSGVNYR